jgi:Phage integrase, N-terminal SAM-like domain
MDLGRFYCQARYQQILFRCDNVASDVTGVLMAKRADLDGAAHLMLAPGVRHLDEETAVFQAMLEGWKRQQDSRYLRERTIGARLRTVRRFAEFTGQYPWQWGPAEVEAFTSDLVSGSRPAAHSTVRNYQTGVRRAMTRRPSPAGPSRG